MPQAGWRSPPGVLFLAPHAHLFAQAASACQLRWAVGDLPHGLQQHRDRSGTGRACQECQASAAVPYAAGTVPRHRRPGPPFLLCTPTFLLLFLAVQEKCPLVATGSLSPSSSSDRAGRCLACRKSLDSGMECRRAVPSQAPSVACLPLACAMPASSPPPPQVYLAS